MYCAACNLNYPDQLSFCRRCGQRLARSASEPVTETVCCTRCGARTVRGEKFCQHCGAEVVAPTPETVVGACYNCGASWRSGWLFCKTCGLDRERALLLPTSMPAAETVVSETEESPEVAKIFCKRCGATAKPFSRYCETCGNTLDLSKAAPGNEPTAGEPEKERITGKLVPPPTVAAFRTQAESPTGKLQAALSDRSQRPAVVETPAEPAVIDQAGRKTAAVHDALTTDFPEVTDPLIGRPTNPGVEMFTATSFQEEIPLEVEEAVQRSDSRGATLVWVIIVVLAVLAGLVAWRLYTTQKRIYSSPNSATAQDTAVAAGASPESAPGSAPAVESASVLPEGMIYVSGGTFKMGRDDGDEFESPVHTVSVKPFFLDRTEVTNEEYQRFVSATGHRAPSHWAGGKIPEGQTKFPVVNVSWNDANAYARWANKRLPTEAEWEFAARGTDGRLYPWGSGWKEDYANAGRSEGGALVETGSYASGASPFGALDMSGNAWEWTSSDFKDYPGRKVASSLAGAGLKVIRGGAFDVTPQRATSTYRGALSPDRIPDKTGFRCARNVQK